MPTYETPDGITLTEDACFLYVRYPHRKTPDLYMYVKRRRVGCVRCEPTYAIPGTARGPKAVERLLAHIRTHDTRKRPARRRGEPNAE